MPDSTPPPPPAAIRRVLLTEVVDLAVRADEAGQTILSVALLMIVRGARQAPSTCRYLVNAGCCTLDAVEAVHRDRRRLPKREKFPATKPTIAPDICST